MRNNWTRKRPKLPGIYKVKMNGKGNPFLALVINRNVEILNKERDSFTFDECNEDDQWYGPLDKGQITRELNGGIYR
jgi:hypothetical protein